MKLSFVRSVPVKKSGDATAHHTAFPRPLRKALRVVRADALPRPQTHCGVDSYMAASEYRTDAYHNQNLLTIDPDYGHDEFGDIDDEFDGLTITEPMDEVALFAFCTGYDIL